MAKLVARVMLAAIIALGLIWQSARSEEPAKITLNFRETDLLAVLDFYSKLTGKVFVPSEQLGGTVTILSPGPIHEDQAVKLLFSVLDMRGFAVVEVDGYYKIVEKAQAMEHPAGSWRAPVPGDRLVTEVIRLEYISVAKVTGSFRSLISPSGKFVADETLNFIVVTDTAANIQMLKRVVAEMDRPLTVPVTRSYHLQYVAADSIAALVENLLRGGSEAAAPGQAQEAAQRSLQGSVLPDKRSNTLFVTAPTQDQHRVQMVIAELDKRSPQVLLEATLVEVSLEEENKLGVQWQYVLSKNNPLAAISLVESDRNAGLIDPERLPPPLGGFNLAILNPGEYAAIVNLLSQDTNARVLSAPHLIASDNEEANLRIGDEIPILKELRLDADNNPIKTFDRQKVGLEVKIKPSIAENRDVGLDLMVKVSSVRSPVIAVESGQVTTSDREVVSHVVVKDQQTLVIGGLIRDDVTDSSSGIPGLRNIPGVGKLFGSEGSDRTKTELLILITPYVLNTVAEARAAGDLELRKHPNAVRAGAVRPEELEFDL